MQTSVDIVIENALQRDGRKNCLFFPSGTLFDLLLPATADYYSIIDVAGDRVIRLNDVNAVPAFRTYNIAILNNHDNNLVQKANVVNILHLPHILIQHNLAPTNKTKTLERIKSLMPMVFMDDSVQESWLEKGDILPYGLVEQEKTEKDIDLLIAGDFGPSQKLLSSLRRLHPDAPTIGNNGRLTTPYKNLTDITNLMKRARYTVCMTPNNQPPLFAMLAMSCFSCPIVNKTPLTEKLIQHEENGILIDNISEVKHVYKSRNEDTANRLQDAARDTISSKYPYQQFEERFTELVIQKSKEVYRR